MFLKLPDTMQAVGLDVDGNLIFCTRPVPVPGKGEVLVKISAAPINPSDIARIRQVKGTADQASYFPGIEGSGTVVAHGGGLLSRLWMGRRVSCSSVHPFSGTWAGYMVTSAGHCIPLPKSISDEQGAMMLVNPMTAVAFIHMAKKGRYKAIINTAAASSLGRMLEHLTRESGLPLINIVRNEKQKNELLRQGAVYVLDSSSVNFTEDLYTLSDQLQSSLILDAVGGKLTLQILQAVPPHSSVILYGNLSGEQPEIDYRSLIMDHKKVSGFFLGNWLKENGPVIMLRSIYEVRKLLKTQLIPVQGRFSLDRAQQALDTYQGNMTAGKVLLKPDL
jgi:NADPH2:quinone reductase